jgi:hypothetical protein
MTHGVDGDAFLQRLLTQDNRLEGITTMTRNKTDNLGDIASMPNRTPTRSPRSHRVLLLGLASGIAAAIWLVRRQSPPKRRFADRGEERRNPLHFFLAGRFPQRRAIDLSGERPLFERRQSVYETYS